MKTIKAIFGEDLTGYGFYWAASKQKLAEALSARRNSPYEFESVYQCNPKALAGSVFLLSDFAHYPVPAPADDGPANATLWKRFLEQGSMTVQAWDTAGSSDSRADYSVCLTASLRLCDLYHCGEDAGLIGECEPHFDAYIVNMFRERMDYGDLVRTARDLARQWGPSIILVEQKSTGDPLLETMRQAGLPVEGRKPGILSKRARATMSVGAGSVQGWMRQHRVLWPYMSQSYELNWVEDARNELVSFMGDNKGHDDVVDALTYLVTYAIEQIGGGGMLPSETEEYERTARAGQDPRDLQSFLNPRQTRTNPVMTLDLLMAQQRDPFAATCDRCSSYDRGKRFCLHHNRKTFALNACQDINPVDLKLLV